MEEIDFMKRIISLIVLAVWCGLLISMLFLPVNVDAVSTTIDNSSSAITYSGSGWVQENSSDDYNGSVSKSGNVNDYAEFNFTGAIVKVAIRRDSDCGLVDIYLDNELVGFNVDTYSGTKQYQWIIYENNNIIPGNHTLKIQVTDRKNSLSSGYNVKLDYIEYKDNDSGDLYSYNPVSDAYVRGGSYAASNYGSDSKLYVKNDSNDSDKYHSLLTFDFSGFSGNTTDCAYLSLFFSNPDGVYSTNFKIYAVPANWSEGTINWNNSPQKGQLIGTGVLNPGYTGWRSFWITPYIRNILENNLTKTISIVLVDEGPASTGVCLKIDSREGVYKPSLNIAKNRLGKYDLDKYMLPVWSSDIVYDESVLMYSYNGAAPEAQLLYTPTEILSVRSVSTGVEYQQGVDWIYENGKLKLLSTSGARYKTNADMYPTGYYPYWVMGRTGGGFILFHEAGFFHENQLAVTYKHKAGQWDGYIPQRQANKLPNTMAKLANGEPVKIIQYGDSISEGANASLYSTLSPYMPSWGSLVVEKLRKMYSSQITYLNQSYGGKDSEWAKLNVNNLVSAENPDLVIIAHGMNDRTKSTATYKSNIQTIMNDVKSINPNAEFILVQSMLPNTEFDTYGNLPQFLGALKELSGTGCVVVDMMNFQQELLNHKEYRDITGNNCNHPSDFLIRCYAQSVLETFLSPPTGLSKYAKNWEFNTDWSMEGYYTNNNISGLGWQEGGYLEGSITGADPVIYSYDNLGLDISHSNSIRIRIKNNTFSTTAKVYFVTDTSTQWNETKSKTFTINANDARFTEYYIDMSDVQGWAGTLKQLRIDPVNDGVTSSGTFSMDYIRVPIDNVKSWEMTVNTDGWSLGRGIGGFGWQPGGNVAGTVTDGDPQIYSSDNLGTDIKSAKLVKIKMKNSTSSTTGQLYFTTNSDNSWNENKHKDFMITANDVNYTEYTIDMSDVPGWTGTLKQIRLDPQNGATSGTFSIDCVRIPTDNAMDWEFDENTNGLGASYGISGFGWQSGGTVGGNISNSDPQIYSSDNLGTNISNRKIIKIKMKNSSSSTTGQIYFTTNLDSSWNEAKSKTFTINAYDSGYTEYVLDMSGVSGWTGTLKQIRIDPENGASGGSFSIDAIRIPLDTSKGWEMAMDTEDWSLGYGITGFGWQTGGYIGGTVNEAVPYIFSADNLEVDINSNKTMIVKMKNSTAGLQGKIYFITDSDTVWNEIKHKDFTINSNDSSYTEYSINMAEVPYWTGTLKRIMFVPESGASSGTFSIDYIRIVN